MSQTYGGWWRGSWLLTALLLASASLGLPSGIASLILGSYFRPDPCQGESRSVSDWLIVYGILQTTWFMNTLFTYFSLSADRAFDYVDDVPHAPCQCAMLRCLIWVLLVLCKVVCFTLGVVVLHSQQVCLHESRPLGVMAVLAMFFILF